jgi:hypothetical protein
MNDLAGGTSRSSAPAGTCAYPAIENGLCGLQSAPADLLHFVGALSVADAVRALGLATGTIHRLRHGYWPGDPRKIIKAWDRYKGRHGIVSSSWFIRRVRPGGLVRHAGRDYTATELAARTGQLLAVARDAAGGLLAQTLELPAQRLPLTKKRHEP